MKTQAYRDLVLLTPSTQGNYLTNDKSTSQRLYVKPEDVKAWREITAEEHKKMMPVPQERKKR